jgi:hypothetical protein
MRINEIIVEQQLEEGPLGAIARGAGKVIGGIAKGVGAIAGIGAGAKKAFQKGKQASVDVIGGTGQGADAPAQKAAPAQAPAGGGAPAAQPAAPAAQPAASGAPAAQTSAPAQPTAQPAAQGGAPAAQPAVKPAAGGSDVDAIIQQVDQLQPPEKKQVLTALQKPASPAKEEPAADPNATPKPTAQPQGGTEQPAAQAQGGAQAQQGGNFDAQTGKPTNQTGQNLETQIQDAKQAAAQKAGRGLSPQEEKDIEAQIRGTMKPKAAPPEDDNPNIVRGTESVQRRGKMVREYTEEFILYRPQTVRTTLHESHKPKQKFSIYRS